MLYWKYNSSINPFSENIRNNGMPPAVRRQPPQIPDKPCLIFGTEWMAIMYLRLKKKSLIKMLPIWGVPLALGIILLVVALPSLIVLLKGPTSLTALPADKLNGAYVETDLNQIVGNFAKSVNSSSDGSTEEVLKTYYVMTYGEDNYVSILINGEDYASELESMQEIVSAYYGGDADELTMSYKVKGTITPLTESYQDYYYKWFSDTEFLKDENIDDAYIEQHALLYTVNIGAAGSFSPFSDWLLSILGLILFALGTTMLILILTGYYQRKVKVFQKELGPQDSQSPESDFTQAKKIKDIFVGSQYTWYFKGYNSMIVHNSDIVWLYAMYKTLEKGKRKWTLICRFKDKSRHVINVKSDIQLEEIMEAIESAGYPLIIGYSDEKEALFNSDLKAFLDKYKDENEDDSTDSLL